MSTREDKMDKARNEGIVFTPRGEPLFARDEKRWREIQQEDDRSDAERAIDASVDASLRATESPDA